MNARSDLSKRVVAAEQERRLALAERAYHFQKALEEIMAYGYDYQNRTQHLKAVALMAQEALESAPSCGGKK